MILVDASVWSDHLRRTIPELEVLLQRRQVLGHVCVRGEVGLGSIARRLLILEMLESLPQAIVIEHFEVWAMVESVGWFSRGIGYVDAHLLASTLATPDARLWTTDKRLGGLAAEHGRAFNAAG